MPIVRLGAGQSNSNGKANVYCKQYGDKYSGLAPSVGISSSARRSMQFRVTKTLAKKIEKIEKLWKLIKEINGEAQGDQSGFSVSLNDNGDILAIGARRASASGIDSGRTRIYKYNNGSWNQIGGDLDGKAANDYSGYSVSLSGDGTIVAISAIGNDDNGPESGHTRIYKYNDNADGSWNLIDEILGEAPNDSSGYSVSLSGDGNTLAIGAIYNDSNGPDSGHTRIYRSNVDGSWNQIGADLEGEAASDRFGWSVSLSYYGNTVAIGAIGDSGNTRIYKYNVDGSWNQIGADLDGEAIGDYSGYSVSLSGDGTIVAIGAVYNDSNGPDSGHTRIYKYNDNADGSWNLIDEIPGEAADDRSGVSVRLSGDGKTLAIGATGNDDNGNNSGHTRIYKSNVDGSWNQIGADLDGEADNDYSGFSVSLSYYGNTLAIGAPNNDSTGIDSGHTRIYRYS